MAKWIIASATEVFRREFRALGCVEGKNIAFVYRDVEGKLDRLSTKQFLQFSLSCLNSLLSWTYDFVLQLLDEGRS